MKKDVRQNDNSGKTLPQTSLKGCLQRTGNTTETQQMRFLSEFNPDRQCDICTSYSNAVLGQYPTLAQVRIAYGENMPSAWLVPQLVDLSEFCGCRDKINDTQMRQLAKMISQDFYYLKISELMLFFRWMKSGKYGHFYGSVDPMRIMCALREFLSERNDILDEHNKKMLLEKIERDKQEYARLSQEDKSAIEVHKKRLQERIDKFLKEKGKK